MPGDEAWPKALFRQNRIGRNGDRDQCGLRVFGELQIGIGALKTELGNCETKGIVSFLKDSLCGREILGERFAHSGELRTLSGEEKGIRVHERLPVYRCSFFGGLQGANIGSARDMLLQFKSRLKDMKEQLDDDR